MKECSISHHLHFSPALVPVYSWSFLRTKTYNVHSIYHMELPHNFLQSVLSSSNQRWHCPLWVYTELYYNHYTNSCEVHDKNQPFQTKNRILKFHDKLVLAYRLKIILSFWNPLWNFKNFDCFKYKYGNNSSSKPFVIFMSKGKV